MRAPPEIIIVETEELSCDGGNQGLGHPRVFLTMTKDGSVDCPYCGRHYVLDARAAKMAVH